MRNTFSWPCSFCGEYNVVDLTGKAGAQIRCRFCFHAVEATPGIVEGPATEAPPRTASDDWIGDAIDRPLFSAGPHSRSR